MVNGKAFVIASEPMRDMQSVQLHNGAYLSWYDGVAAAFSDDKRFVIIGDCWSIKKGETPSQFLAGSRDLTAEKILEQENCWCGRYVLILENTIYMDATGAMSIFYHDKYVSNSLNLLRELLGYPLKKEKLFDGVSPDFVPGTKTQYDGVRRLLPSLVYDMTQKTVSSRPLLPEFPLSRQTQEEQIREFVDAFAEGLRNLDRYYEGKTKLIACTGGRDSRTVLAVSEYAGLSYDTFTLEHDQISGADSNLPQQLSSALGRKHYYIKKDKKNYSSRRLRDFDRHICGYEKGADRDFCGYRQLEELKKQVGNDIVLLRGSVWGVATDYYRKYVGDYSIEGLIPTFPLIRDNRFFRASVEDWLDHVRQDTDNREINVAERVFWDLREGCWMAIIEQTFDLYDGIISVQPINCRRLIALLMGFDLEDRIKKTHEEKITAYSCPPLKDIPYDYRGGATGAGGRFGNLALYCKKAFWLLGNYGPGALMFFIKNKVG